MYIEYGVIAEKYLNSIYAYNFPIFIAVPGTVSYLRNIGFDVFDDIVDHSYDKIQDPVLRLVTAINANIKLFDKDYVIPVWELNKDRFNSNILYAKSGMYQHYEEQIMINFTHILDEIL